MHCSPAEALAARGIGAPLIGSWGGPTTADKPAAGGPWTRHEGVGPPVARAGCHTGTVAWPVLQRCGVGGSKMTDSNVDSNLYNQRVGSLSPPSAASRERARCMPDPRGPVGTERVLRDNRT